VRTSASIEGPVMIRKIRARVDNNPTSAESGCLPDYDGPPERLERIAAATDTFGLEQQRLVQPIFALSHIEQEFDQRFRRLCGQMGLDRPSGVAPPGFPRFGPGFTLSGLLGQPR
jgi:hypothetical protein